MVPLNFMKSTIYLARTLLQASALLPQEWRYQAWYRTFPSLYLDLQHRDTAANDLHIRRLPRPKYPDVPPLLKEEGCSSREGGVWTETDKQPPKSYGRLSSIETQNGPPQIFATFKQENQRIQGLVAVVDCPPRRNIRLSPRRIMVIPYVRQ